MKPPPEAQAEALRAPNGWVLSLEDGSFRASDEFPPSISIIGAWKVDAHGRIVGGFALNPDYRPRTKAAVRATNVRDISISNVRYGNDRDGVVLNNAKRISATDIANHDEQPTRKDPWYKRPLGIVFLAVSSGLIVLGFRLFIGSS